MVGRGREKEHLYLVPELPVQKGELSYKDIVGSEIPQAVIFFSHSASFRMLKDEAIVWDVSMTGILCGGRGTVCLSRVGFGRRVVALGVANWAKSSCWWQDS